IVALNLGRNEGTKFEQLAQAYCLRADHGNRHALYSPRRAKLGERSTRSNCGQQWRKRGDAEIAWLAIRRQIDRVISDGPAGATRIGGLGSLRRAAALGSHFPDPQGALGGRDWNLLVELAELFRLRHAIRLTRHQDADGDEQAAVEARALAQHGEGIE